jgi:DNA-directed RNA polymerase subunit M/transcription elongation factor TFIIS
MGSDQLSCPGCSGPLLVGQVDGSRRYVCDDCGGIVIGIAVLRQLSGAAGQHIWTAEPAPPPPAGAGRCPFCATDMGPKTVPMGTAAICRACEVVWLDKQAASSLPVRNSDAQGQPTLETQTQSARCQQCGAPIGHTWDERCRYCGTAIHAPTKVVVLPGAVPEEGTTGGRDGRRSLFSDVMRMLARPLEG